MTGNESPRAAPGAGLTKSYLAIARGFQPLVPAELDALRARNRAPLGHACGRWPGRTLSSSRSSGAADR